MSIIRIGDLVSVDFKNCPSTTQRWHLQGDQSSFPREEYLGVVKNYRGRNLTFPEEYLIVFPNGRQGWVDYAYIKVEVETKKENKE